MLTYPVNEIFLSLQGEGVRAGSLNVFVRFAGCNKECTVETVGFDCDTDHQLSKPMTATEILAEARRLWPDDSAIKFVLTGGEPALQLCDDLSGTLSAKRNFLAIETNGSIAFDKDLVDWITVSPKEPIEELSGLEFAHELKIVLGADQPLPKVPDSFFAFNKLISPKAVGDAICQDALSWRILLVQLNPSWGLSTQQHKIWKIR